MSIVSIESSITVSWFCFANIPSTIFLSTTDATRTSTDQVSGFGSAAKRTIGNKVMGGRMADNFERARKLSLLGKDLSLKNLSLDD